MLLSKKDQSLFKDFFLTNNSLLVAKSSKPSSLLVVTGSKPSEIVIQTVKNKFLAGLIKSNKYVSWQYTTSVLSRLKLVSSQTLNLTE